MCHDFDRCHPGQTIYHMVAIIAKSSRSVDGRNTRPLAAPVLWWPLERPDFMRRLT